jgi:outer membrane immunogenic protein
MRTRTLAGLGFLAALASAGAASAADLAPIYRKAPPVLPVLLPWTGLYGGFHGGGGTGNKKFIDNFPTPDGETDADVSVRGWLAGLQVGYNYQVNWLVVGVEGEFTWSDLNNNFSCFTFGNQVCSAHAEWFATMTGRIGGVIGSALVYLKGGAAWVHDNYTDLATCVGPQANSRAGIPAVCGSEFISRDTRLGWVLGIGVEYMFARNWTVKLEYNHMDFGGRSVDFFDGAGNFFTEEIHQRIDLVKAGINYKFDWAASPVVVSAYAYVPPKKAKKVAGAGGARKAYAQANDDDDEGSIQVFSGVDVSKRSADGWVGALIAVNRDLDTSGPRVMLLGGTGVYRYPVTGGFIRGVYSTGDMLAGWGFEGDNYSANLLVGANAANHILSDIDPENSVQGTKIGVKVRGDLWHNPTPLTLVYGEGEYSTAFQTFHLAGKFGYDATNGKGIFLGPEAAYFGDQRFNQWRIGGHATQLKVGKVQIDLAAGYAHDSINGDGAYGRLEMSSKF